MFNFKKYLNTNNPVINENLAKNTNKIKNYRTNDSTSFKQNINVKIVEKLNVDDNILKLKSFKKQPSTATTANENNQPEEASENNKPAAETSLDTVAATAPSELKSFKKQPSADTAAASELKSFKINRENQEDEFKLSLETRPEIILKDFKTYAKRDHVHSKDEIEVIVTNLTGTINENKKNTDKNKKFSDNLKLDLDIYKYNQEEKFKYFYDKKETQKIVDKLVFSTDKKFETLREELATVFGLITTVQESDTTETDKIYQLGEDGSTFKFLGDLEVNNNITLNDGGSLKEGGGTSAFTFDSDGHVTKIGQSTPSNGLFLSWDGSKAVWDTASGGGSGDVSASSNFGIDNLLIRSHGTSKGVQVTGITVSDSNDVSIFDDTDGTDVTLKIGTSSDECLEIITKNGVANKTAEKIQFISKTLSGTANHGQFVFKVDEVEMFKILDDRLFTSEIMEAQSGVITNKLSINADNTSGLNEIASITLGTEAKAGFYVKSDDHLYIENDNQDKDIIFKANVGGSDTTIATVDGTNGLFNLPAGKLAIGGSAITATAAELNILDASATTAGTTAVSDGHGIVMKQGGATTLTTVETLAAYLDDEITAMPNLVTTAALASGSIASGFGTIATANTITTSAAITGGSLVLGTGVASSISHTADADDEDFTISHLGNHNASLILSSAGTAADALQITTTAGGIDITNGGAASGEDLDITSTSASLRLSAGEAVADAIVINASDAAGGIDIDAGTGGIDIDTTGVLNIDCAGSVSMINHSATAGGAFMISMNEIVAARLMLSSSGTGDNALQIITNNGGMDITSAKVMDITTTASNSNINITPHGTGSVVVGTDLTVTSGIYDKNIQVYETDADLDLSSVSKNKTIIIAIGLTAKTITLPDVDDDNLGLVIKIMVDEGLNSDCKIGLPSSSSAKLRGSVTLTSTHASGNNKISHAIINGALHSSNGAKAIICNQSSAAKCGGTGGSIYTFTYYKVGSSDFHVFVDAKCNTTADNPALSGFTQQGGL